MTKLPNKTVRPRAPNQGSVAGEQESYRIRRAKRVLGNEGVWAWAALDTQEWAKVE